MSKEVRAFNFEVRAEQNAKNGYFIEGLAIAYEKRANLGYCDEIIKTGALKNADLRDVKFLVNHNTNMIPLARSRRNNENSTMQLKETDKGLNIRVNLDVENNTEAKSLYSAVQRGDIDQMSFMFTIDEENWKEVNSDHPTREVTKIGKVFEVSAVTFPAYPQTELSARDSAKNALENVRKSLESERKQCRMALELEKIKNKNKGVF